MITSIFEHSSWVAGRAFDARPFTGPDGLHGAMIAAVESASADEKLALLRAHPDLGTRAPRGSVLESVLENASDAGRALAALFTLAGPESVADVCVGGVSIRHDHDG